MAYAHEQVAKTYLACNPLSFSVATNVFGLEYFCGAIFTFDFHVWCRYVRWHGQCANCGGHI